MHQPTIESYLAGIGVRRAESDLGYLRRLQLAHLRGCRSRTCRSISANRIRLDPEPLADKIINRRRGGFCYELNGLFADLLVVLGHRVSRLSCQVFVGTGQLSHPFDHLALLVELDKPYLVAVGFGTNSHHLLRMSARNPQAEPEGEFLTRDAPDGDLDVIKNGGPQYRVALRPRPLRSFVPTCWWQQTSPDSHVTQSLTCSVLTADRRATLSDRRPIVTSDGKRVATMLQTDAAVDAGYQEHVGFDLDRLPIVHR